MNQNKNEILKRLMNSHRQKQFTWGQQIFHLEKRNIPGFNPKSLDFIIASFIISLSLKIVKNPEVFLMVKNTHLRKHFPSSVEKWHIDVTTVSANKILQDHLWKTGRVSENPLWLDPQSYEAFV